MEREHWSEISQGVCEVARRWKHRSRDTHPTALIVRVHLWAVGHNESINWACKPGSWDSKTRPEVLPDQSTMSRRSRRKDFWEFLQAVGQSLAGKASVCLIKRIDGKPLPVAAHSSDPDAAWGRGAGQNVNGYRLCTIWGDRPMPEGCTISSLAMGEKTLARRMFKRLEGVGYLLADGHFDASDLYDAAAARGHQLVSPRQHPGAGLGHHYQSPHRLRSIELLEREAFGLGRFGPDLFAQRRQIERDFGNACNFSGGMLILPPFVRRIWRVRPWIYGKLLFNAARIRCLRRRRQNAA